MKQAVDERFLISPFLVFFIVHATQVGVGVLGFQRPLMKEAGQDAWMAVLLAGLAAHALIWLMYRLLAYSPSDGDIVSLHEHYFGRWFGGVLSTGLLFYYALAAFTVLQSYIEIIKVWVFPLMGAWQFSLIFLVLTYYVVSGGFRVVASLCFWGVVIPLVTIFPMLFFSLEYAQYRNLLPVFDHSPAQIIKAANDMALQYLGFEMLLMYYPFLKNAPSSQKWAHAANALTTFIYLTVMFISIIFYNKEQIEHVTWPTLTLAKIPQVPFIERMEYIVISIYVLVVFPIIAVSVWAATRIAKQLFSVRQRRSLPVLLACLFIGTLFFQEKTAIERLMQWTAKVGFSVIAVYVPLLYVYVWTAEKVKKALQQKP
ncbi:GerAB/ArcD/ProY family transporter [Geobacillus stearothermophilus]|uniref:GerAB/ArcD/ProY family transporter n=1 Tax=Geobacillus stearothermophilus TaxID=1422 RepID=UPI0024026E5F|nr:GerAB/ArcD/ProY family transporter [Geobacillus stearothermophilus]MDF9296510.1 GerAB/ArcD/ProY family transporter [Geobacillus stearothermophilus]WJQ13139.1 GerAB/ArcD/ProY family transporter [Geobacillus stearothermophilus]